MLHRQRRHQCLCGTTPLLRASSYIARLFLSGKLCFLKALPLSKIFVISERVCFFFPILTAPVKAEKWSLNVLGRWIFMRSWISHNKRERHRLFTHPLLSGRIVLLPLRCCLVFSGHSSCSSPPFCWLLSLRKEMTLKYRNRNKTFIFKRGFDRLNHL